MKSLVAYFSATGTTKKLAQNLAGAINADLYEILPEEAYTEEDLDWTNKKSRSSYEMANLSFRPKVRNKVADIAQYDKIFVGFPIWWYIAPTIINSFLEQYNLAGKTIIPFATSGGSSMGKTNENLKDSCKGAILKEGKRFSANTKADELKEWAKNF